MFRPGASEQRRVSPQSKSARREKFAHTTAQQDLTSTVTEKKKKKDQIFPPKQLADLNRAILSILRTDMRDSAPPFPHGAGSVVAAPMSTDSGREKWTRGGKCGRKAGLKKKSGRCSSTGRTTSPYGAGKRAGESGSRRRRLRRSTFHRRRGWAVGSDPGAACSSS